MPLPLARCALSHRNLERPQLCNRLQTLDSVDSLHQVVRIRVPMRRLVVYRLEKDRVLLQMLRWAIQEMLQVEVDVLAAFLSSMSCALLDDTFRVV